MWMYLKIAKKHFDGRMGYKLSYNHYLGPSKIYHMVEGSEKKLAHCTYTGLKINWTFKKYDTLHKNKHNILDSLKRQRYNGIDQQSKVRYLSKSIKTTGLDLVKTCIMSDETLRHYFDG